MSNTYKTFEDLRQLVSNNNLTRAQQTAEEQMRQEKIETLFPNKTDSKDNKDA